MTDFISTLKDGIETVEVKITHDQYVQEDLARNLARGRYAVVEWVLTKIDRFSELDRVCGLDARHADGGDSMVLVLRLRQVGKQLEAWVGDGHANLAFYRDTGEVYRDEELIGTLSPEARSNKKFTDDNPPWWAQDVRVSVWPGSVSEAGSLIGQTIEGHRITRVSGRDGEIQLWGIALEPDRIPNPAST